MHADISANIMAIVVNVLEFGEGLDEVSVFTKVLGNLGQATV